MIATIVLPANAQLINYNFGEVATTSISGFVYLDANNNGVMDSGETGIAGVTVKLTGADINNNPVTLSTTTAGDGSYGFTKLAPSSNNGYTVTEVQPAGYLDGKTTIKAGNSGAATSTKPLSAGGSDVIARITLAANDNLTNYNFGETPGATVSGFVYVDANNSGAKDAGEAGIPGVTVTLTGTDTNNTAVTLTTATAADGSYSFTALTPSSVTGYTITEIQPSAYADGKTTVPSGQPGTAAASKPVSSGGADTITKIVVIAGATLPNNNFGELSTGSIAGFVYVDANNNGVLDSGETGIAGVTVKLTGTDSNNNAVSLSVTTGGDGSYSFTKLMASNAAGYTVTEIQPSGYLDGKTTNQNR